MTDLPQTYFFALYSTLVDRFIALECAGLTGEFRLERKPLKQEARRERLAVCHQLQIQIAEYRSAIRKDEQFNRKVDLNVKIKQLEDRLKAHVERL